MQGYLALALHAHLPYVRHVEEGSLLEENWLFEAITETYVPLFLMLDGLLEDGIDFRLTFSLTPTLASMLLDPLLQSRYVMKLEKTLELAEKEVARTVGLPDFHALAGMYLRRFLEVRDAFIHRYRRNLVGHLRSLQDTGKVAVLASAATHGYLPVLSTNESSVRAQVGIGVEYYRRIFGRKPEGFWLPECGYYPGLDGLLSDLGIRYTILETHGITRADHRPRYGVHAPVICPSGVAAFGRDPDCSRQVWSSITGYPGDYDYREFYRDIGYDLDLEYIGPYIDPSGIRTDTGIKYYRITGEGDGKEPYVPERAERKAAVHAEHFLSERIKQVRSLAADMDRKPVFVAPYDAELFGHWWFEGPRWLDHLFRRMAKEQDIIRPVTLPEYLAEYPSNQLATPSMSSWGRNGFNEVWLSSENNWIYRHLHNGAELMERLVAAHLRSGGLPAQALDQAARELLLAQASDWAFMLDSGAMKEYAARRTKRHLARMHRLARQIESGSIDDGWLRQLETQDHIFAGFPVAHHFPVPSRTAASLPVVQAKPTGSSTRHLDIVMACSEIVPFAKTGGLADMVASLAPALERLGHRVRMIMPAYRDVLRNEALLCDDGLRICVPMARRREEAAVLRTTIGRDIPVYFIRSDRYFDRPHLYGAAEGDYPDNAERFVFFARGVLEVLRRIGVPHVLHAHDWQAALALTFVNAQPELYPGLSSLRTVLTVHNLGYQGIFPVSAWELLGLDWSLFTARHLEFYGKVNFLKGGITFADAITTVSPSYSREIQTPENGFGLDGILRERASRLTGILNGADYEVWSPQTDRCLVRNYGPDDLTGKALCKADLQRAFGLTEDPTLPLLGMVARLVSQKGIDLLEAVADRLFCRHLQLVVLGSGDRCHEEALIKLARRYPDRFGVRIAFDEALAHKVQAGSDMLLMPSRYEPGGLNQLYSLKYGTIPIVRSTGGLKDSVEEFDPSTGRGNGFVFEPYEGGALLDAVDRALITFFRKDEWTGLMRNAMTMDYGWDRSAAEYVRLYRAILGGGQEFTL